MKEKRISHYLKTDSAFQKEEKRKEIIDSFSEYNGANIDVESAIKADVSKQNFSVFPRGYYADIQYTCEDCERPFLFSANEQKAWYEEHGFYVDSRPNRCLDCRKRRREQKISKERYDSFSSKDDHRLSPGQAGELFAIMESLFGEPRPAKVRDRMKHLSRLAVRTP